MESINDRIECIVNERFSGNKSAFAKSIEMDRGTLANYIGARHSKPSVDMITKIVVNLHINPEWLLTGEGHMSSDNKEIAHHTDNPKEGIPLIPYSAMAQ